jgi:hypothetical protein
MPTQADNGPDWPFEGDGRVFNAIEADASLIWRLALGARQGSSKECFADRIIAG